MTHKRTTYHCLSKRHITKKMHNFISRMIQFYFGHKVDKLVHLIPNLQGLPLLSVQSNLLIIDTNNWSISNILGLI